jgi:alpha-1,2-mannosyltransferase
MDVQGVEALLAQAGQFFVQYVLPGALAFLAAVIIACRYHRRTGDRVATDESGSHGTPSVGLLHPASGAGGGGERVLWVAVAALMQADERAGIARRYVLYTKRYAAPAPPPAGGNAASRAAADDAHLLGLVHQQFGITVDGSKLTVVYITRSKYLDAAMYPRLTLLLQSLVGGFMMFVDLAVNGCTDVVIDTVGIPFAYPFLVVLSGVRVACFIHYPVISTDMLSAVRSRRASFNNSSRIANSYVLTQCKVGYYRAFATLYSCAGWFATAVMTNSSWTKGHICALWGLPVVPIVFPPVNIKGLAAAQPTGRGKAKRASARANTIVGVGQFRPEKDHRLQLAAFARALPGLPKDATLVLVGGCRDENDRQRVKDLRCYAHELGVTERVRFEVSVPYDRITELLTTAAVGIHAMRDEHFGISVVEYMAGGCVALAHDSAGPKMDIIRDGVDGFLRSDEQGYADALCAIFAMKKKDAAAFDAMSDEARSSAQRFSDESFARKFLGTLAQLLSLTLIPDEDDVQRLCC